MMNIVTARIDGEFEELNKVQLAEKGARDAKVILDGGFFLSLELMAMSRKLMEYLTSFSAACDSEARSHVTSPIVEMMGVEFSLSSTGERLDLENDPIYSDIKNSLKERADLLKLAHRSKDKIYDYYGVEVPKVSIKHPSREVLKVKL